MKKLVSTILAVIMIFGATVSLYSCGAPEDAGAEISVYLGETVYDFDPTDYYADKNAEQIMSLLFEPLFKLDSDGDLKNAAAKEYDVDTEKRKIVIKLRESYWSDEIRVKAEDYIYAWREVVLEAGNPNPAATLLYDIENAAEIKLGEKSYADFGAVATGSYEITITYREGANYKQLLKNLASVATSPLRQDIVSVAPTYWSKDTTTIVSNGPFRIETLNYELGEFSLARNIGYHQKPSVEDYTEKVNPAKLVSFVTTDGTLKVSYDDLSAKTVFYMGDASLEDRATYEKKAKTFDDLSTYAYVFNTDNPLFADKNVRKALSIALDRQLIAKTVTFGKAATGFLSPSVAKSIYGKNINRISTEADIDAAKDLLKSVNFEGLTKSFTLTVNNDEESVAIANIAKQAWKELGFTVNVKKVGYVTAPIGEDSVIYDSEIQRLVLDASYGKQRDFDVIAVDWQMYSNDAFVALASFSSSMNGNGRDCTTGEVRKNISGWTNSAYDAHVTEAYKTSNKSERKDALKSAEEVLLDSCPIIPIIHNETFAFVNKDISKLSVDGYGNLVFNALKQKNYKKYLSSDED